MKSIEECDRQADKTIAIMITGMVGGAIVPAAINWSISMTAMGAGVVAIGHDYGYTLDKEGGADLVKMFFSAAGSTFIAFSVGSKICSSLMQATGGGYLLGVALDVVVSGAQAYAVGGCAKAYFRKKYLGQTISKEELGKIFRERYKQYKKANKTK